MKPLVIGIAGGSGSGKSTLAHLLSERFESRVTVINCDNYYKPQDGLSFDERCKQNYDSPSAFESDLLIEHIKKLKDGEDILCPVYDFTLHSRSKNTQLKKSEELILIDGILILQNEELRNLMDIKIFVDADSDIRLLRRIKRDVSERGRTLDSVLEQYLKTVKPMHEAFVEPSKNYADIILSGNGKIETAVNIIENAISEIV